MTKNAWWKEGVIYQIYPRSFKDSNGDGIGDLRGIIESLDYLAGLHVDILWLSPIFLSPNDDNGYDVSGYRGIMPDFGTMADFEELLEKAKQRGLRVILDIVANHCSDEHPWFLQSKSSIDNPYRDYFFWKKPYPNGGPPNNWRSFFGGSAWELDEATGEYYLHLFSKKQPDLNWENPALRQELYDILHFWFKKGVDGVRLDVITLISKRLDFADADFKKFRTAIETVYANGPRLHEFLQEMNQAVFQHYDVMALGEGVGIRANNVLDFVGEKRGELDLIYHFDILNMTFGEERYAPAKPFELLMLKGIFQKWYDATREEGWIVQAMGNHDYPRIVSRFGDDQEFWKESAKLLIVLMATQRGTLNIYQGDEIGMTNTAFPSIHHYRDIEGLNFFRSAAMGKTTEELEVLLSFLHHAGRDNARTPFQWDASEHAGFSTSQPWLGLNPNYPRINRQEQEEDPGSILHFYRKMLRYRKENPVLVYGEYNCVQPENTSVYAYMRTWGIERRLVVLNFSKKTSLFSLKPGAYPAQADINNYPSLDFSSQGLLFQPFQAAVLNLE
jgi:oligo-1,6-glucosidase